jgi:glycosyltransferase involved in cell wall biosynthesis
MTQTERVRRRIGLLATEMATHGGVQSFMQRVSEVIGGAVAGGQAMKGYCFSLNDNSEALRRHPAIPANLDLWGAARSKKRLITHALLKVPRTDVLFVGHLGAGPVAHVMKRLGRVHHYYVILHGIEAWKRVALLDRRALMGARKIIATTRYTAEECGRLNGIPADHFTVIPLCADERSITPSPTFRLDGGFKLLCVARQDATERHKGFEHIFAALAELLETHPQVHLNLVGDGNDQPSLRKIATGMGIEDKVTFWGRLPEADLAAAYQECDVFVMPSRKEGFGIVFLEAMRYGKPCIGGNHGGTPDVIEHGRSGYLVEYGDVSSLTECIRRLADESALREALGLRGAELIEERFSFRSFATSYRELLQRDALSIGDDAQ